MLSKGPPALFASDVTVTTGQDASMSCTNEDHAKSPADLPQHPSAVIAQLTEDKARLEAQVEALIKTTEEAKTYTHRLESFFETHLIELQTLVGRLRGRYVQWQVLAEVVTQQRLCLNDNQTLLMQADMRAVRSDTQAAVSSSVSSTQEPQGASGDDVSAPEISQTSRRGAISHVLLPDFRDVEWN